MKLSKTKKIILLGATLGILTTSIVTPIVLLNKDEKNQENNVEKLFKILKAKTTKEKIIELPSDASGKIIANNQEKIISKIKNLIGKQNLKGVKIEVSMQSDINISTISQKITIKLTKNKVSKEIKDFSIKRNFTTSELANKDIESIKNILDAKSGKDLKIILSSDSTGNIIENANYKNEIIKKIRILIDPSNINGQANHSSLRGTSIDVLMTNDVKISTIFQNINIIVLISKTGGTTLTTRKTFKVKRNSTPDEDIRAIWDIFDSKERNDFRIILPSSSTGRVIDNGINENNIKKKLRILIDPSNTNGDPDHPSLRGTTITLKRLNTPNDLISVNFKGLYIEINKAGGTSLVFTSFMVKKSRV